MALVHRRRSDWSVLSDGEAWEQFPTADGPVPIEWLSAVQSTSPISAPSVLIRSFWATLWRGTCSQEAIWLVSSEAWTISHSRRTRADWVTIDSPIYKSIIRSQPPMSLLGALGQPCDVAIVHRRRSDWPVLREGEAWKAAVYIDYQYLMALWTECSLEWLGMLVSIATWYLCSYHSSIETCFHRAN